MLSVSEELKMKINGHKSDFERGFQREVHPREINWIADAYDAFVSDKKLFKGFLRHDNFEIKLMRRFFDFRMPFAKAKGTIRQHGETVHIEAHITGLYGMYKVFKYGLLLFYALGIGMFVFAAINETLSIYYGLLGLAIHALIFLGLGYLFLKRSAVSLKAHLTRELPNFMSR